MLREVSMKTQNCSKDLENSNAVWIWANKTTQELLINIKTRELKMYKVIIKRKRSENKNKVFECKGQIKYLTIFLRERN